MLILLLLCVLLILFRKDIAFQAVHGWDKFKINFDRFNPVKASTEQLLVLAGGTAFFVARTKDLRKHSITHPQNRGLLSSMFLGVVLGFLMDIDD